MTNDAQYTTIRAKISTIKRLMPFKTFGKTYEDAILYLIESNNEKMEE